MPNLHTNARIAVIDDDELGRGELVDELRDCNFEPVPIVGPFGSDVNRLLSEIRELNTEFVICDHKLQAKGFASFHGLDVVKRLIGDQRPAMLLTMYQSPDRL